MRGAEQADSAGRARVVLEQDAGRMDRADPAQTIL
jgi:hypothetical protein